MEVGRDKHKRGAGSRAVSEDTVTRATTVISLATVVGVFLGGAAGYFWPEGMLSLGFIGELFLNALRLVIIPLIVAGLITGVASIGDIRKTGRSAATALVYFVGTTIIAVGIGLALVNIIGPGYGVERSTELASGQLQEVGRMTAGEIVSALIPANHIEAMLNGRYFGIILFSLLFGAVLTTMASRRQPVVQFFRSVQEAVMKLTQLLLYVAPVGLFCLVGAAVAANAAHGGILFDNLGPYLLVLGIGFGVHAVVVLPLAVKFLARRSPWTYLRDLVPAFSTAFGTGSSSVALPVTYDCVVDKSRVDSRAGAMTLPLGTTINLDATAMYAVVAAIFVAHAYGISVSAGQMILMGLVAVAASIGVAGVPGAGLMIAAAVFGAGGFPAEAYAGLGLVVAADWLVDRARAVVNVWSDAAGAAVVAERMRPKRTATRRKSEPPLRTERRSSRQPYRAASERRRDPATVARDGQRESRHPKHPPTDKPQSRERSRPSAGRGERNGHSRPGDSARTRPTAKPSPFEIPAGKQPTVDLENPIPAATVEPSSGRGTKAARPSPSRIPVADVPSGKKTSSESVVGSTSNADRTDRPARKSSAHSFAGDRPSGGRSAPRSSRAAKLQDGRTRRVDNNSSAKPPELSKETETVPAELASDTIERERSRVVAQLAEMKKIEELQRTEATVDRHDHSSPPGPTDSAEPEPAAEHADSPRIDYLSETEAEPASDITPTGVTGVPPAAERESSETPTDTPAVAYGRRTGQRGHRPGSDSNSSGDQPSAPTPESTEGYALKNQTFGRSKKKRTR